MFDLQVRLISKESLSSGVVTKPTFEDDFLKNPI